MVANCQQSLAEFESYHLAVAKFAASAAILPEPALLLPAQTLPLVVEEVPPPEFLESKDYLNDKIISGVNVSSSNMV